MPLRLPTCAVRRPLRPAIVLSGLLLLGYPTAAAATSFTDPASFFAAISGTPATLDFDGLTAGDTIPNGGSVGGITFTGSIPLDMIVSDIWSTTSASNYLGLDDGGTEEFIALDEWEMAFASPLQALGMYFISPDALFADDIVLMTSAGTAGNSDVDFAPLADGGLAYFIGIVSDGSPFTSAQVRYGPHVTDTFFVYNVDDISTVPAAAPVPEPSTLILTSAALAGAWARRRSRRRHDDIQE